MSNSSTDPNSLHKELKKRESELALAEQNLDKMRQEFEEFAYIISHDLQEPLRMVYCYTQLLAKRYSQSLDQSGLDFLHYAQDGAFRMQAMIDDLLAYSRVTTKGQDFEPIQLNQVLEQVQTKLQQEITKAGAAIHVQKLPTVLGDTKQLHYLFEQLVGNALKFCTHDVPQIHISSEVQQHTDRHVPKEDQTNSSAQLVCVKDNGIGIDPEHHDSIFQIFRKLHPRSTSPGTGMGLAVCKRIIQRHGGRIWVDSEPGQGATFCCTFSAA